LKVGVDIGSRGLGDSLGDGEALGLDEALGVGLVEGDGVGTGSWAKALRFKSRSMKNKRAHMDIG
jgi:hypothetical protein